MSKPLRTCGLSERTMRRAVCQPTGRKILVEMFTNAHKHFEISYIVLWISSRSIDFSSRHQYNTTAFSSRLDYMYDDYDLDYTYTNDHAQDLDEIYDYMMHTYAQQLDEDLDDEYARDTHDYADLAYKHYAWYNAYPHAHLAQCHTHSRKNAWFVLH